MKKLISHLFFAPLLLIFVSQLASANPDEKMQSAQVLDAGKGCWLMFGGVGSTEYQDDRVGKMIHSINGYIAKGVTEGIVKKGYDIEGMIFPYKESSVVVTKVTVGSLKWKQCNRFIQIASISGENNKQPFFGFDITIMRIAKSQNDESLTFISDYRREYHYPDTEEGKKSFVPSDFVERVQSDIENSNIIEFLRKK